MTKQTTIVVIGALRINNYKAPDKINIEVIILDVLCQTYLVGTHWNCHTEAIPVCILTIDFDAKKKKKKKKGKLQTISFIWIYVASEFL